jgi:hypothetical protein
MKNMDMLKGFLDCPYETFSVRTRDTDLNFLIGLNNGGLK